MRQEQRWGSAEERQLPGTLARTMRFAVSSVLMVAVSAVFAAVAGSASTAAARENVWQLDRYSDPATARRTALLTYGVPETDDVQVRARCAVGGRRIGITFRTDVGSLENGHAADLAFSGGGVSLSVSGKVAGVGNTQERIAGVRARIGLDHPLWNALRRTAGLDYFIPGYRTSRLALTDGRANIDDFISACRRFASAADIGGSGSGTSGGSGSGGSISEKEAFEIAKDLGTIEAWEAFLSTFPTGFRAELARAYVRRLAAGGATTGTGTATTGSGNGQTATSGNGGATSAGRQPIFVSPDDTAWWVGRRNTAYDGGRGTYAASIDSGGVELIAHCHAYGANRDLTVFLREARRGSDGTIAAGLRAAAVAAPRMRRTGTWDNARSIGITFSDGSQVRGAATNGNDLQRQFHLLGNGRPFKARGAEVGLMMSARTMRITAPKLDITLPLKNSRAALCTVLKQCGVRRSDCRGVGSIPTSTSGGSSGTTPRCTGGRFYSRSRKSCRCPRKRPVWNGVSCERGQTSCGKNFRLVNGQCVQRQNCGRNKFRNVEGDCFCKRGFVERSDGRCVRRASTNCTLGRVFSSKQNRCVCPRSARFFYGGRCRPVRDCPGDSDLINGICQKVNDGQDAPQRCGKGRTWVGGQGRCVCVDGRKRWNGKRCVFRRNQTNTNNGTLTPKQAKEAACGILQIACAAGSNSSCRKFRSNGC
ncbi:MAG: hypothetical protein AAFQ42_05565 [Pseudomonadota bacterium]